MPGPRAPADGSVTHGSGECVPQLTKVPTTGSAEEAPYPRGRRSSVPVVPGCSRRQRRMTMSLMWPSIIGDDRKQSTQGRVTPI